MLYRFEPEVLEQLNTPYYLRPSVKQELRTITLKDTENDNYKLELNSSFEEWKLLYLRQVYGVRTLSLYSDYAEKIFDKVTDVKLENNITLRGRTSNKRGKYGVSYMITNESTLFFIGSCGNRWNKSWKVIINGSYVIFNITEDLFRNYGLQMFKECESLNLINQKQLWIDMFFVSQVKDTNGLHIFFKVDLIYSDIHYDNIPTYFYVDCYVLNDGQVQVSTVNCFSDEPYNKHTFDPLGNMYTTSKLKLMDIDVFEYFDTLL